MESLRSSFGWWGDWGEKISEHQRDTRRDIDGRPQNTDQVKHLYWFRSNDFLIGGLRSTSISSSNLRSMWDNVDVSYYCSYKFLIDIMIQDSFSSDTSATDLFWMYRLWPVYRVLRFSWIGTPHLPPRLSDYLFGHTSPNKSRPWHVLIWTVLNFDTVSDNVLVNVKTSLPTTHIPDHTALSIFFVLLSVKWWVLCEHLRKY